MPSGNVWWRVAGVLLLAAVAAGQEAAPSTADELRTKILESAATGKFTDELTELFVKFADLKAREKLVPRAVTEEFWTWLAGNKTLYRAVLVNLHPRCEDLLVKSLAELRQKCPAEVDKYPHLAMAFVLNWTAARGRPISGGWIRKPWDPKVVPGMVDSFRYYTSNARRMIYPLETFPWPVLVYMADNDLPLDERTWVLNRFTKLTPEKFGELYYEVPYDMDGLTQAANQSGLKISSMPYTLQNILEQGGVCSDRAYYTSRILKSLGVPAFFDCGEGDRGGHAWTAWIAVNKGQFGMLDTGRFDFDKYYTGEVQNPLASRPILDRDVELIAVGMNRSYEGYIDTMVAAHIFRMYDRKDPVVKPADMLKEVLVKRNHYSAETWQLLSAAVAKGALPRKDGEVLYKVMAGPFAQYPDLTFRFLQDVLKPRLEDTEKATDAEVKTNVNLLDQAFALYEKASRPDLAVSLRLLQGMYMEATGHKDKALLLYMNASQQYVKSHYGFIALFERANALLTGPKHEKMRRQYLEVMVANVPEFKSDFNKQTNDVNPAYIMVLRGYLAALKQSGDGKDSAKIVELTEKLSQYAGVRH